jgi:OOP family OmpA-OmpF porin
MTVIDMNTTKSFGGRIMKLNHLVKSFVLVLFLFSLLVGNAFAAEAVIEKETVKGVVITKELIKKADNFIVMFDSSSSMGKPHKKTGLTRLEAAEQLLKGRNEILPDLGYTGGLYLYTPFKPVYAMQPYDREKFARAIEQLPTEAGGPTMLQEGLHKLDDVLAGLSGRTVVFIFTGGQYSHFSTRMKPVERARELAEKYNVCFYVISFAEGDKQKEILKAVASINACSRVVPFDQVFAKPVYLAGALFVIDTRAVGFVASFKRVAEINIDNILFDFDSADIRPEFNQELNLLGTFLQNNPQTYVVLTGFTDSIGSLEYNLGLSRRRAESVQAYLTSNFNVGVGRIVTQWHGSINPASYYKSPLGRRQNRRVECIVLGLD